MERIIILGGGYAGSIAAARLAHRGVPVTLIDAGAGMIERIRLHQVAAGQEVPVVTYKRLFRNLPVSVIQARVTSIDRERKMVDGVPYDRLIYALGSMIDVTTVPGVAEHALTVQEPKRVFEALGAARSVIVCGGGLTGIESAAEIAERFPKMRITLLDAGTIGGKLAIGARDHLRSWFDKRGVTILEESRISRVEQGAVILANGKRQTADVILWCGSFSLPPIARAAGLRVNARGQIIVDENLRSSDPSIFAIGDAAIFADLRMACATALPMGAYVADYIAGATDRPFAFAFAALCISLGRNDGIIQLKNADDSPRDTFLSGRLAAWVKELVCRFALTSIRLERIGVRYQWPKKLAA